MRMADNSGMARPLPLTVISQLSSWDTMDETGQYLDWSVDTGIPWSLSASLFYTCGIKLSRLQCHLHVERQMWPAALRAYARRTD